jgi:hypothetical protein
MKLQELLYYASIRLRATAASLEDDNELEQLLHEQNLDDNDIGLLLEDETPEILRTTGCGLAELAASLLGPSSRGQYNQFEKVHDWFPKALRWPDADFRHSFR